jgi:15-cis-phytoene synthase
MTTFPLATRLFPRGLREDVQCLYLAFRTLDNLVDDGMPEAEDRVAAVEAWCDGRPARSPEARIFDELSRRHPLPRPALRDFCAGMRFDLERGDIRAEEDLDLYCYRVAGTVGLTMTAMLGGHGAETERRAIALGMAMQRTNVLRDIDEDLAIGRVYLARETIDRFGGSVLPGARSALVRDQIRRADALYDEGIDGIRLLPHGRHAVAAASVMYREILRQIEREGYGERAGRAVVPAQRKIAVAARRVALSR